MISRRKFITGLLSAPFIIRTPGLLMPISTPVPLYRIYRTWAPYQPPLLISASPARMPDVHFFNSMEELSKLLGPSEVETQEAVRFFSGFPRSVLIREG